jgi:hypothetical protein
MRSLAELVLACSVSVALPTLAPASIAPGHDRVFCRVFMPLWTVGNFCALRSGGESGGGISQSPAEVFLEGYGFQVLRVNTAADPAEMVYLQSRGDLADEQLVSNSVGLRMSRKHPGSVRKCSIAADVNDSSPEPATRVRLGRNPLHEAVHECTMGNGHRGSFQPRCSGRAALQRCSALFIIAGGAL